MAAENCFIRDQYCTPACMAYTINGKTTCRLINAIEKLVPVPTRPTTPPPPKVSP